MIFHIPAYLFLPLFSSILYTVSVIIFKKILKTGVNSWVINFLSNIASGTLAVPFYFVDPLSSHHASFFQPFIVGLLFLVGQTTSFFALKSGDVSVATPLLGIKVILVALFTVIVLAQPVSLELWVAAFLASSAFILLRGPRDQVHTNFTATVAYSFISALCFALCDILIQKWAPAYGSGKFLALMFMSVSIYSLGFIPFFRTAPLSYSSATWRWLIAGVLFIALQTIGMAIALSYFGNATEVNIIYSLRGIWSVLLVWWFGQWFENREKDAGKTTMVARLVGSMLLFAAIVLIVIKY